jgi:hypothetical protein
LPFTRRTLPGIAIKFQVFCEFGLLLLADEI